MEAEAAVKAIQDLDIAARAAEERALGRCGDSRGGADEEAATAALTAAYIHVARMERAKELKVTAEDLVPVALQAAGDFRQAYRCNRAAIDSLSTATAILVSLRAGLPAGAVRVRENVDSELAEINALKATHAGQAKPLSTVPATPTPEPAKPGAPAPGPAVAAITGDQSAVELATPRRQTDLGRFALRLEAGFGAAKLYPNGSYLHRGAYFRAQILARFIPGQQERILLLFGPYYNILGARDSTNASGASASKPRVGNANMHGLGVHFELQWQPRRTAPWLSLHPFADIGIEHIKTFDSSLGSSGFQGGGGLLLCAFHSSICPNVRLMTVPAHATRSPTVQVGVAFDLLRWLELGLSRTRRVKPGPV